MKIFFMVLTATILLGANNTAFGAACSQCMNGTPYPSGCTDLNNVCGSGGGSGTWIACSTSECTGTPDSTKTYTDTNGRKYTCSLVSQSCGKRNCNSSEIGGGGVITGQLLNMLSPIQSAYAFDFISECDCHWVSTYGKCKCEDSGYGFEKTTNDTTGVCKKICTGDAYVSDGTDCICRRGYYHPAGVKYGTYKTECSKCPSSNTIIMNNQSVSIGFTEEGQTAGTDSKGIESCYLPGRRGSDNRGEWTTIENECFYTE